MPIKAVAFDVDGTLYPNVSMYIRSLPFALTHLRLVRAYSRVRRAVRTQRPVEDLQALERRLLAVELGVDESEAARLIDVEIHENWESTLDRVRPYPHLRQCIEQLKAQGLHIAVNSDFPVERKLARLDLADLFDCTLWSEQSGYLKPHPEPFLMLAECVGEAPANILYVGNSYAYDVVGAKSAGMLAAHLRRLPVRGSIADLSFADYRRLAGWVEQVNAAENTGQTE